MIAFIISQFPSYDETFIARELGQLMKLGLDFRIYSLKNIKQPLVHDEVRPLIERTVYMPFFFSLELWKGFCLVLLTRPHKVLYAFLWVFFGHLHKPVMLLKSLAMFPKSVYYGYLFGRKGVKLVHAHWATYPTTAAFIISTISGVPFSFTAHAHDIFVDQTLLASKTRKAEFVFTCTADNKRFLERYITGSSDCSSYSSCTGYPGSNKENGRLRLNEPIGSERTGERANGRTESKTQDTGHKTQENGNRENRITGYPDNLVPDNQITGSPANRQNGNKIILSYHGLDLQKFQSSFEISEENPNAKCQNPNEIQMSNDKLKTNARTGERANGRTEGKTFRILSVGSLLPCKGFEYLIDACAILKDREMDFICDIIGGGPLEEALAGRIKSRNLDSLVFLNGYKKQNEILPYYQRADVFALSAVLKIHWGIPNVVVEAMAHKVPAIITELPAMSEVIVPQENGIFVAEKDPAALADKLEFLYKEPSLRKRMGESARNRVEELFDQKKNSTEMMKQFSKYVSACIKYDNKD